MSDTSYLNKKRCLARASAAEDDNLQRLFIFRCLHLLHLHPPLVLLLISSAVTHAVSDVSCGRVAMALCGGCRWLWGMGSGGWLKSTIFAVRQRKIARDDWKFVEAVHARCLSSCGREPT